jgi:transcriptional regulator with XRE-family HTH domain
VQGRNLIYREFGLLLAGERKRKRLSQAEFAALAGLSRTSITNIECGRQAVQLHQLYSFASILHIEIHVLLPKETVLKIGSSVDQVKSTEQVRYLELAKKLMGSAAKS